MDKFPLPKGFSFSQSSLQDYQDCPYRFHLRYMQQLPWPAIDFEPALDNEKRQQEGRLFHRLVQQHLLGIPDSKLTRIAGATNISRWWENFYSWLPNIIDYTKYIELVLSIPLQCGLRMMAKYDLLLILPGKHAVIYDWKTSARHPRSEYMATRLQTCVYRAILVQAGTQVNNGIPLNPSQVEMIYWFAEYPSEPSHFYYDEAQYERDYSAINKITTEIISAISFPKTENDLLCLYCVYRSYCERGSKAGEQNNMEYMENDFDLDQIQEIEL